MEDAQLPYNPEYKEAPDEPYPPAPAAYQTGYPPPQPASQYGQPAAQYGQPAAQYGQPAVQYGVGGAQPTQYPDAPPSYGAAGAAPPLGNVEAGMESQPYTATSAGPVGADEPFTKFTEKSIRLGFIKRVFSLLLIQLLITTGLMCIFIFVPPIKQYLLNNSWVYITSICLVIAAMLVFGCVTKLRKLWPVNLICLFIITLLMSTMLGSIAATMEADEILIAVGIVIGIVAVCAILGFQTKFDFTPKVGVIAVFSTCLFLFGFMCIFWYNQVTTLIYCSLGALLFALWLVLDIQLILGGKHKLQFDPEDYVGGALTLYVDIVYMLMMIFFIFKAT